MQTSNHKLRKQALAEGPTYNYFVKAGLALESAASQAVLMEKSEQVSQVCRSNNAQSYQYTNSVQKNELRGRMYASPSGVPCPLDQPQERVISVDTTPGVLM